MYLPITGDDLFYKHRDGCGDIRNHIIIVSITEQYRVTDEFGHTTYVCYVDMQWDGHGSNDAGITYTYSDAELEDPDDIDGAVEYIVEQVK